MPDSNTTYKGLYELVQDQIDRNLAFRNTVSFRNQLDREDVKPILANNISDLNAADLISSIQTLLNNALPSFIISGLEISALSPAQGKITVTSGKGSVGGSLYTLLEDTTLPIPFDSFTEVFYVTLHRDRLMIEKQTSSDSLALGKIVVPAPGKTSAIYDNASDRPDDWQGYIISYQEFKLHANQYGQLEEDSLQVFRDSIGQILADNIIGNIRLSENLKIITTSGSLELDSNEMKIINEDGLVLARYNNRGIFYYDTNGIELARFASNGARIGNILITKNTLETENFSAGVAGFQIKDDGNAEFNNTTVRGTLYATAGEIGGFTIASNKLYGGTIQTNVSVAEGSNGVVMDDAGLRVYDDILGLVVNLPSDGSAPSFSSGTITEVTFEIQTNTVIRTSSTVGDGSGSSEGILINSTGIYGCGANQTFNTANLRVLSDGNVYLKGEIQATSGVIGGFTITATKLSGGTIEGATLIGTTLQTATTPPRILIDSQGLYYQVTASIGKYSTFKYGDGTKYGAGNLAVLFNTNYPVLAVLQEQTKADVRLYNRSSDPASGSHENGDLICTNSVLKICKTAGSPGTFHPILSSDGSVGTMTATTVANYVNVNVNGTIYKLCYIP